MNFIKQNLKTILVFILASVLAVVVELVLCQTSKPIISLGCVFISAVILTQFLIFKRVLQVIRWRARHLEDKLEVFSKQNQRQENINRNLMVAIEKIIDIQKKG